MIAMPGEVIESTVHATEQPGYDKFELDLFEWPAMKLFGGFDFQSAFLCGRDDGIRFTEFMRDRHLQRHMQACLDRHQPHFTIGVIVDADNASFGRRFTHEFDSGQLAWHTEVLPGVPLNLHGDPRQKPVQLRLAGL